MAGFVPPPTDPPEVVAARRAAFGAAYHAAERALRQSCPDYAAALRDSWSRDPRTWEEARAAVRWYQDALKAEASVAAYGEAARTDEEG